MKVLLLKPPMRASMIEIGRHMPVGLLYLASMLRDAGHEVAVFDSLAHIEDNHVVPESELTEVDRVKLASHPRWRHLIHWGAHWSKLRAAIEDFAPDVVGVSCMFTPHYEPAYEAARLSKSIFPDVPVLLGGQHPTVAQAHVMAEKAVDVVVRGEAEQTIAHLIAAIEAGTPLTELTGLTFRCGAGFCECDRPSGGLHVTAATNWNGDLDSLPLPASDMVDWSNYDHTATVITSRGCPFACTFCTVHAMVGKKFRSRTSVQIVDEFEHYVRDHGVRNFFIEDDNFTFDIPRVHAICEEIRRRELDIRLHLPNGMTVVKLDEDLVHSMHDAGFRSLFLGLETTDQARLKAIRKNFTSLDKVRAGAQLFGGEGVEVGASLIVGLLGQDVREIAKDSITVARSGIRFWTNPFYPIPGSTDFQQCLDEGLIRLDTEYALFDQYNFAIGSTHLTPLELYWSWIATQAIAQWSAYVFEEHQDETFEGALAALGDHVIAAGQIQAPTEFDAVGAVPVAVDGRKFDVHRPSCFCALHALSSNDLPLDLCQFSGDIVAAVVSLRLGRPVGAVPTGRNSDVCSFELVERTDEVWPATLETFKSVLATADETDKLEAAVTAS
ncbi:hypothetical protein Misp01_09960 [Microtetraspora sp. NBRC 13810]|uniref:B12-binding domain-containing radical SAM protein n=1 Tax=Microtetraspora sp. NBRC 13810 TaxID=3030990 RepID=UPI0024A52466|nr:radical SAM protein [Microtetraspora sp. NBRC 13810]GLW05866.1 hypothetical protein Misp01_09960 [Microtetraspora sp. NBRC 13810]